MKSLILLGISLLLFTQPASADDRNDAEEALKKNINQVLGLINDTKLSPVVKRENVMKIVGKAFDFPLVAKLTLGRKIWPTFTKDQKSEFINLFSRQLENTYYKEIQFFSDQEIIFEPPRKLKKKIHILTKVFQKDKVIQVLYKMYNSAGTWKVYDAEIQGVSIISSYRAQYREFLKSETVDNFIKKLRSKKNTGTS